jgi:hypothetical protein
MLRANFNSPGLFVLACHQPLPGHFARIWFGTRSIEQGRKSHAGPLWCLPHRGAIARPSLSARGNFVPCAFQSHRSRLLNVMSLFATSELFSTSPLRNHQASRSITGTENAFERRTFRGRRKLSKLENGISRFSGLRCARFFHREALFSWHRFGDDYFAARRRQVFA